MKKYLAEFAGTFILVFCGTGASIVDETQNGIVSHVGVAMTWGLVVMAMIYTFGEKSGAHFNPAVTVAFTVQKSFPLAQLLPYILCQTSGALCASFVLKFLFPDSRYLGATLPAGSAVQSWVIEAFLTLFLMLTALSVSERGKEKGLLAGLAVGAVVLLEAMFAGPVSGASMNPARSLAPAVASGYMSSVWIYLTAPVVGSVSAVIVHRLLR